MEARLITREAVIAESCYLLRNLLGAPEAVIKNVAAEIFQILSREWVPSLPIPAADAAFLVDAPHLVIGPRQTPELAKAMPIFNRLRQATQLLAFFFRQPNYRLRFTSQLYIELGITTGNFPFCHLVDHSTSS